MKPPEPLGARSCASPSHPGWPGTGGDITAVRQRVLLALRQTGVYSGFHLIVRSFYSSLQIDSLNSKMGTIALRQLGEP